MSFLVQEVQKKGKGKAKKLTYTTLDPEGYVVTEEKAKKHKIRLKDAIPSISY